MRPQLQSVTLVNPHVLKDVQRYERRLYPTALSVQLFHDQGVLLIDYLMTNTIL